jgi:hypothetical protein
MSAIRAPALRSEDEWGVAAAGLRPTPETLGGSTAAIKSDGSAEAGGVTLQRVH